MDRARTRLNESHLTDLRRMWEGFFAVRGSPRRRAWRFPATPCPPTLQDGDSTMASFNTRKTECPISRAEFKAQAKSVELVINGQTVVAQVKEFSTGSFGWHFGDKVTIKVGDQLVKCQVGLTITAIGSK